jgi:hypothetical protein
VAHLKTAFNDFSQTFAASGRIRLTVTQAAHCLSSHSGKRGVSNLLRMIDGKGLIANRR